MNLYVDEETNSPYIVVISAENSASLEEIDVGRRYRLVEGDSLTIGSGIHAHIQLPSHMAAEEQAKIDFQRGQWYLRNLSPAQTTYDELNMVVGLHLFKRDGEVFRAGSVYFKFFDGKGAETFFDKQNFAKSRIDSLTKAYNRTYLLERIEDELSWFSRPDARSLSLLMFDADHFKRINDTYGHLCGDKVLKTICQRLQKRLRKHEKLGRYGGEEFLVIMPQSDRAKAVSLAEEIRILVSSEPIEYEGIPINATVSIGVATLEKPEGQPELDLDTLALVNIADKNMYKAKHRGRNQVCA